MTDETPRLELDWVKTIAGALAAVSTAVLLSTLGAAGTLIGAALGSVAVTVSSALYSQALARSRAKLTQAQDVALQKVGVAQAEVRRAARRQGDDQAVESHLEHADRRLAQARADLDVEAPAEESGWRERLVALPWKRLALLAAALFVTAVVVISVFELVAGRTVASYTGGSDGDGGTTITRITGPDDRVAPPPDEAPADDESPAPTPTDGGEPSEDPTGEPTIEPSDLPTAEPTGEPLEPSPTPPLEPSETTSP